MSNELNEKQIIFCEEYILDWNATRAARVAGYSENSARQIGSENLTKPYIKEYIEEIQKDLSKIAGISRLRVLREWENIAFSSMAHLHNTWMERKDFEDLTEEQKACISEIKTKVTGEYTEVLIKLYSKEKALESISKMLGYNEPEKIDHTSKGEKINNSIDFSKLDTETLLKIQQARK